MNSLFEIFFRALFIRVQKALMDTPETTKTENAKSSINEFNVDEWKIRAKHHNVAYTMLLFFCILGLTGGRFSLEAIITYGGTFVLCGILEYVIVPSHRIYREYEVLLFALYNNPINDYINLLDKFILAFPKRKDFKTKKAEALLYSGEIKKALHYAECLNEKFPGSKYYQNFESKMKIVFLFLKNDDSYKSISFFPQKNDSEFEKLCFVIKNLDSVELRDTNLSTAETLYDSPLQFYKSIGALLLSRLYSVSDLDRAKECCDASVQYSLSEEMSMCINKYAQDLQSNDINEVDF